MDQADEGAGEAAEKVTRPDLVDRLEDVRCDRAPFTPDHAQCICRLTHEAAAEITRLRKVLEDIAGASWGWCAPYYEKGEPITNRKLTIDRAKKALGWVDRTNASPPTTEA